MTNSKRINAKLDKILLDMTNEEREILAKKLNNNGNA